MVETVQIGRRPVKNNSDGEPEPEEQEKEREAQEQGHTAAAGADSAQGTKPRGSHKAFEVDAPRKCGGEFVLEP